MIIITGYISVKVYDRTPSGSGKYMCWFGLRIETGAERTIIVDILT